MSSHFTSSTVASNDRMSSIDEKYSMPLEEFSELPENKGKKMVVGIVFPRPSNPSTGTSPTELLFVKRAETDSMPHHWEIPGGGAELSKDGTIIDSAIREAREETGMKFTKSDITDVLEGFDTVNTEGTRAWKQYCFVVDNCPGLDHEGTNVTLRPREHSERKWVKSTDVDDHLMNPGMKDAVDKVFDLLP